MLAHDNPRVRPRSIHLLDWPPRAVMSHLQTNAKKLFSLRSLSQGPIKEICCRAIRFDPTLPQEKPMDFVGEDHFFHMDVIFAQSLHQVDSLAEGNIAIVIAVDQ